MALIGRQMNWRDPRFQRAQARLNAVATGPTLGLQKQLITNFVGQQMQQKIGAARLREQLLQHQDDLGLKNRYLDLARRKHDWEQKLAWKDIRGGRAAQKLQLLLGMGTAGLHGWMGRENAAAEAAFQKRRLQKLQELINLQTGLSDPIDPLALDEFTL